MTGVIGVASAVRAIAAAAVCVTSTAQGPTLGVQLCHTLNVNGGMVTAAASWLRRASGDRSKRQQIEQQSHAGPFAAPKPESMMVPRGARRSDQKAHPGRLEQARRFLPSWSCEFDSRHPL
jgi:hypothetical protein